MTNLARGNSSIDVAIGRIPAIVSLNSSYTESGRLTDSQARIRDISKDSYSRWVIVE